MDIDRSLRAIQSLSELPQLVAELGHHPLWEPVPDELWTRTPSGAFQVWVVGQTGGLPWFALESRDPERDAVRISRRINTRGRVALLVALDPAARRLGVAVAFDRCPGIELDLAKPSREALAALQGLAGASESNPLAFAARAAEALSAEPVGRRFFREFRATLDRMEAGLSGPMPAADRRDLVLLQLTRVLFLYFIQAKGWLSGRGRFLAEEVDRCLTRRRRIHRDVLKPLFFGTLNQPVAMRSRSALQFGAIPFLNGGLFEPHPLERQYRANISNELWRDAFEGLFERFHFTVTERGHPGSVAPDMLGRVFEGVMEPEARRTSGTFYTPALLVERLLDAALVPLVAGRLSCSEVEADRRLRNREPDAAKALRSITLLDPAVGSGAFLLHALERLSALGAPESDPTRQKRRVLRQNLFGVDRNAAAVRLTELRLWLAVIADDPTDRPESVIPLPNLDCLIRQGDSLFDPVGLDLAPETCPPGALSTELAGLRREVIGASGPDKRMLERRLRGVEMRMLDHMLGAAEQRQRAALRECLQQARASDLFGHRRGLDRELRIRLEQLRSALRQLRHARRRMAREGETPWFHYRSHFADVFTRGGFDVVIGNPPWLRSEAMPPQMRRQIAGHYRWWRAKNPSYGNSPDLAVAFLERGFELASPNGVVAMLVPAKIMTAGYGALARHELAATYTLHVVADLTGTVEAAFDATVYPLALVASKSAPRQDHQVRTSLALNSGSQVKQSELSGGGPWIMCRSKLRRLVATLEHAHPPLGETISCHLGVKTGLNRVFLSPPADLESEVLRWAVRGRDVSAFRCHCRIRLLWSHDRFGRPVDRLPPNARAYLTRHETALRARRDYQGGPPWVLFRVRPSIARYRVIWSDLARRLTAAALTTRCDLERIPLNTCYVAPINSGTRADALAAWLNSTWVGAVARLNAVPASGGFARFNAQVVAQLPLPPSALTDPALARLGRLARHGTMKQEDLDQLAARHLRLSRSAQEALRAMDGTSGHRR